MNKIDKNIKWILEKIDLILNDNITVDHISTYQEVIRESSAISDILKNNKISNKKENLNKFIELSGLMQQNPNYYFDWIYDSMLQLIENNPFLIWHLQFLWNDENKTYFSDQKMKWNYSYRSYVLFLEIATRYIFDSKEHAEHFLNSIQSTMKMDNDKFWSTCSYIYGQYSNDLLFRLGLWYGAIFNQYGHEQMYFMKQIQNFFIFIQNLSDKELEEHKYHLWKLFENHQKSQKS